MFIRKNYLQIKMYNVIFETMNSIFKKATGLMVVISFMTCCSASAQHRHHHHHPQRVITVVAKPATTVRIDCEFNRKERFQMAIAYLKQNQYLSIKKYAKMTGLPKDIAEAELDVFACNEGSPITLVVTDKKKLYTKR